MARLRTVAGSGKLPSRGGTGLNASRSATCQKRTPPATVPQDKYVRASYNTAGITAKRRWVNPVGSNGRACLGRRDDLTRKRYCLHRLTRHPSGFHCRL